jgi:MFS family permease
MIALGRRMGARYFITFIVLAWALVMVGHGLVKTWHQMLALRCLLGIFEAGYFSMATYLLSTWYTRSRLNLIYRKPY